MFTDCLVFHNMLYSYFNDLFTALLDFNSVKQEVSETLSLCMVASSHLSSHSSSNSSTMGVKITSSFVSF